MDAAIRSRDLARPVATATVTAGRGRDIIDRSRNACQASGVGVAQRNPVGKLTTHVLDTAGGRPAAGMRIDFASIGPQGSTLIATVHTNAEGRTDEPLLDGVGMRTGTFEVVSKKRPRKQLIQTLNLFLLLWCVSEQTGRKTEEL